MNEVHITTAKIGLLSLISGAAVALIGVTPEFGENSTLRNLVEYF